MYSPPALGWLIMFVFSRDRFAEVQLDKLPSLSTAVPI
jgi:hypothetical protein